MQILLMLGVVLALWLWRVYSRRAKPQLVRKAGTRAQASVLPFPESELSPTAHAEVVFRMRGERGAAGPVYGDVMCRDGVYLPRVWESDFHTSFDGRWIRTGSYGGAMPRLLDRKTRRSWSLSVAEAALLDDLHWRLPRWTGHVAGNGVASDGLREFSDAAFGVWLSQHVVSQAQALAAVCDLWVPADSMPATAQLLAPALPQQDNAAVQLSLKRYWPASLRGLEDPLAPVHRPQWQLQLNGEPQSWILEEQSHLCWRADGQAFACYGYSLADDLQSSVRRLGVWSVAHGGQQWSQCLPEDRRTWSVVTDGQEAGSVLAESLRWEGEVLLQRMCMDTPELERLHDGRHVQCMQQGPRFACSRHQADGRVLLKPIPRRSFWWCRDLSHPMRWVARSEVVAGQPLCWTLTQEAQDASVASAGYTVTWGSQTLPGLWELEHVVVDGQWVLLLPWSPELAARGLAVPWSWDGRQLNAVAMTGSVLRMRPHVRPGQAQVLVAVGCGPDNSHLVHQGLWRWPLQTVDGLHQAKPAWSLAYEWRDVAVNAQGVWQLQLRWREVQQIQHPSADGDYVWHHASDAVWWWGGLHNQMNNRWQPRAPRCEGVLVTQSGAVLCGVGPAACPHYAGDGWLSLEWLARGAHGEPHHWKLHWLRPYKREVWTLDLRAYLPQLHGWDAHQGIQWLDSAVPVAEASDRLESVSHIVAPMRWERAQLEVLKQSPGGLWVRKQDAVYADAIALREEWPWIREDVALPQQA